MNNITLIGMPGVGKSTLGVVLAKILGYQFLDSEDVYKRQGLDDFVSHQFEINKVFYVEKGTVKNQQKVF